MEQEIQNLKNWLTNSDVARTQLINDNDKRLKAIEADLKNLTLSLSLQTQSNSFLVTLKEEVKKNNDAQITLNKLFTGQIKDLFLFFKEAKVKTLDVSKISITPVIKPEVKIDVNYLLNLFKRKI